MTEYVFKKKNNIPPVTMDVNFDELHALMKRMVPGFNKTKSELLLEFATSVLKQPSRYLRIGLISDTEHIIAIVSCLHLAERCRENREEDDV